jgi:hypothetical protein
MQRSVKMNSRLLIPACVIGALIGTSAFAAQNTPVPNPAKPNQPAIQTVPAPPTEEEKLASEVASLSAQVASLASALATLKTQLTTLSTQVSNISTQIHNVGSLSNGCRISGFINARSLSGNPDALMVTADCPPQNN